MTARHEVVIVVGSFFGRSPEWMITAQQVFARRALAASVRGGELDD